MKRAFLMNKVALSLMFIDVFVNTGLGLIEPILAVFITDYIEGVSLAGIGIASMIFLVTKSLVQIPFSIFVDKKGDRYDMGLLLFGTILISMVPFVYIFATHMYHIYIAQLIFGLGSGMAYPAWLGLWSTHLDKGRESYEWSLYSTVIGLGTATTAALGAFISQQYGYTATFLLVGAMSLFGCLLIFLMYRRLVIRSHKKTHH